MRELFVKMVAIVIGFVLISLSCIASSALVLNIFDWLMGTAYTAPQTIGIGALVVFVFMQMIKK